MKAGTLYDRGDNAWRVWVEATPDEMRRLLAGRLSWDDRTTILTAVGDTEELVPKGGS